MTAAFEPTASLYDQIVAASGAANAAAIAATQAREQLLQDKANGVFDGADGKAATVEVGTVITGSPEENAQVYATGTPQEVRLNFVLPRGKQGPKGEVNPSEIAQAVEKYMDANPIQETDPTVPAWAKQPQKPTYTAAEVGALPDTYKPPVDATLTHSGQAADAAKVGEELRSLSEEIAEIPSGKDGADGITPTIGDNGNWYLGDTDTGKPSRGEPGQDGADGKDGAPGAAGADGYTPVKGTDYFTAADKQEIAEAAAGMVSIPDKLPNPNALTFTGAVSGSYDGSAPLEVDIPSGGVDTVQKINATFSGSEGYVIPNNTSKTVYKCGRIVFINLTLRITAADENAWHVIVTDIPSQIDTNERIMSFVSRDGRGPCRVKVDGNNLVVAGGENSGATAITWYDIQCIYISAD